MSTILADSFRSSLDPAILPGQYQQQEVDQMAPKTTALATKPGSSQHALDMPGQKIGVDLTPFVAKAAADGFTFAKRIKLTEGEWIAGLYLGAGTADVTDATSGETKTVVTALIEISPGVSIELLAAHQVERRLAASDIHAGSTIVLIRRGPDFRTPIGRMVTEYDIGVKNPRTVDAQLAK